MIIRGRPVLEGAGVMLKRIFGFDESPQFDPFLLLDDFSSDNPKDFLAGFPWHPHRGIETVTYIISGSVEHGDSLGNKGVIRSGNVQWMTAGSGIIHQEMPKGDSIRGFQLWVNLPKKDKMMGPRYRDINQIPEVKIKGGKVKVIAGDFEGTPGPVRDIVRNPDYFDIEAGSGFQRKLKKGNTSFAYVFEGKGTINNEKIESGQLIRIKGNIDVESEGIRFILVSGKPLNEPVAWRGPIVMNTQKELENAFLQIADNTFIK